MSRIFWDSNLFIYLFEDHPEYAQVVAGLREKMLVRRDQLLTSSLTLGEVLVKPTTMKDLGLCRSYEDVLSSMALIVPFDLKVARKYASIRSNTNIKEPDAVQLACAGEAGVDLFITNDHRLQGKQVEGVHFIVGLDQVPI